MTVYFHRSYKPRIVDLLPRNLVMYDKPLPLGQGFSSIWEDREEMLHS